MGETTAIFADDFDGSQLSPIWGVSTFQGNPTDPATATLSQGLLNLASVGPTTNGLEIVAPFVPTGDNLTVTARVRANSFGRFHMVLETQPGKFDEASVAAAFEFDLTGTLPTDCGNKGAAIERIGSSDSVFSCNTIPKTWYQLQIVATDNPYSVTWNFMNDTGSIIATTSATSPDYSFSSIRYLALGVWYAGCGCESMYDVDWIIASSPIQPPIHAGSSGTTTLVVNPRTTSTSVTCDPASVQVSQTTTCTATVTDTAQGTASTPTGVVTWKSSGSGVFSTATCILSGTSSSASCSVNYTPKASGSEVITASYGGSTSLAATSQPTSLVVSGPVQSSWQNSPLLLAGLLGGVGAVGILIGVAVTVLAKRRLPKS